CVPCKEETPALQRVYQKLHDQGLVIIGVDLRNQERKGTDGDTDVRAFTSQYGVTYPIALDVAGDIARVSDLPDSDQLFHRSNRHNPLHCGEQGHSGRCRGHLHPPPARRHCGALMGCAEGNT
ncbi:MAG: TlpA disulfide reductase family protein, partial [Roseiflexaceae bacterium]